MMWAPVISKIEIRGFNPHTSRINSIERKITLRDEIRLKMGQNLKKVLDCCRSKPLSIDVCFYLFHDDDLGRSKKDLDNLLKILLDVLDTNMVNGQDPIEGLGLVTDDSYIYKIKCEKVFVNSCEREGMDLQVFAGH